MWNMNGPTYTLEKFIQAISCQQNGRIRYSHLDRVTVYVRVSEKTSPLEITNYPHNRTPANGTCDGKASL